ncbi:hypothetical protein AAGS40_15475 [Paraburkholderia sp. PREW-6R]|uniref:hypothetical protein n=1 Tax=Paraburkholderia sp. PREW-6R TaxID=3141544 RepID=UPI0031F50770
MALTESLHSVDTQPRGASPVRRDNVIPFPSARGRLQVTLPPSRDDQTGAALRALLHSPLGVYVVSTEVVRGEMCALLDIAVDDLDFTLHTLISTLPAAQIGPLTRRPIAAQTH